MLISMFLILFLLNDVASFNISPYLKTNYHVWDNVLDQFVCRSVDASCISSGNQGHKVIDRKLVSPRNGIESIMCSVLQSLSDHSRYVEYWWRDEWINLDAHADVDEVAAKNGQPLRFPNHGHVLYLQIGESVEGPTVLFLDQYKSMIVIPAIAGRLLRFHGETVHSVPRPKWAYFDPEYGGTNHEIWIRLRRQQGVISDEVTINRRSVLLFNTWDIPPEGVSQHIENRSEQLSLCANREDWIIAPTNSLTDNLSSTNQVNYPLRMKIGLLGDKVRRGGRGDRSIWVQCPKNAMLAFSEKSVVSKIGLI